MSPDLIVIAAAGLAVAFVAAWLLRPDLRRRVEQPKYRFQARVQRYDRERGAGRRTSEDQP